MSIQRPQFSHKNPLNLQASAADDDDDDINGSGLTEEQQLLQEDIDGSHLARRKRKTGAQVRLDFDSDSSDDGQTRREKGLIQEQRKKLRQSKSKGREDDDSDDMFGDSDEDKDEPDERELELDRAEAELNKSKRTVEFLDVDRFEQEMNGGEESRETKKTTRNMLFDEEDAGADADSEADIDDKEDEVTATNVDIDYFVRPDSDYQEEEKEAEDGDGEDKMDVDEEEDILRRKKKKPVQEPKLEGFNLRDDLEEGKFDVEGNFIRHAADENVHQDAWLEGVSKKDIAKARRAHLQRQRDDETKERTGTRENGKTVSGEYVETSDYLQRLIERLDVCETPMEALQNLRKEQIQDKKRQQLEKKHKRRRRPQDTMEESAEDSREVQKRKDNQKKVEEITECTDSLLNRGLADVYSMMREELMKLYTRETGEVFRAKRKREDTDVGREEEKEKDGKDEREEKEKIQDHQVGTKQDDDRIWEFQWEGSDEIHGPYDSATMRDWIAGGYFQEARALVRPAGTQDSFEPLESTDIFK
ncbi:uncharacterized protein SAPINGB_P001685 [Magnusiomyces paraingens]|uniref:GYF domain-containing protein n=1 Tax=Magnusiomyces paraingens TaxID=2606893 RepID=A0A5E8B941_9ASCO|nr:uncharacterized protein SAPINGB_P001685 [Saprochaete ingens]VVT47386.1 unnamed protein product [Saprochaete ingens]